MTSNDKKIIYNLLKTASSNIQGYKSQDFTFDISKFKDDIKIIKSENNTTNISFSKNEVIQEIKNASIDTINNKITKCNRCRLCETRKNVVPGIGCKSPLVLVIGEGPGYEEDLKGEPFVGPAGQLLDKMLAAIQLSRNSNTYIANIVKCRPPQNRIPYPEEADACISFLQAQIVALKPKMILCAGSTAAKNILKSPLGVTKLRGNLYEYSNIPVCVTYHPSALLRDESLKKYAWEDLKMFRQKLLELVPNYQESFRG